LQSTKSIQNNTFSPILDRQIDEITAGLPSLYYANSLRSISNEENIKIIVDYIIAARTETNLSDSYRKNIIEALCRFSKYHTDKPFKDITRDNIIAFLDSFRKTETQDPLHKWIGTYNIYKIHLLRFFKWLYSPNIDPDKRVKPPILENIPKLKRKEKSIYKPSDMWTQNDDLLFLRYCPSKRDKCYHAMSRDLSCRPSEILKLKNKDIAFKNINTSQYVEVVVNGKTGTRPIPLINSIPYLKDYLDHEHPQAGNPNSPLICGNGKSLGRHLSSMGIARVYIKYKTRMFPKLLKSPNINPEDKQRISELLKKPWNPYIRRHSALTEKSIILKEHVLRQHAGWTADSQMHLKYLHYFGNESNESLLEAYGLIDHGIQLDQLKPKACTNCNEPNKPDSKFCIKCRMVLTYDAYAETLKEQEKQKNEMEKISKVLDRIDELEKRLIGTP
jgi:integrase/recombinase XerD